MAHEESVSRPSRRTIAKGAAWTVPAIAVATPAQAQAVSGVIIVQPQGGQACKFPGNSCSPYFQAYRFVFCFTNLSAQTITVSFPTIVLPQGENTTPIPASIDVPGGANNLCFYIIADEQGNSANGEGTLFFEYTFNGQLIQGSVGTGANDLPPCGDCSDTFGVAGAALVSDESLEEETTPEEVTPEEVTSEVTTEESAPEETTSEETTEGALSDEADSSSANDQ